MNSLFGLIILVLDIVALIDIVSKPASVGHKILWALVVLLLPVLGMILYFLLGRSRVVV